MVASRICRRRAWLAVCPLAILLSSLCPSRAIELTFESAGVRGGFSADAKSRGFDQVEIFADWNLPWRWDLGRGWVLDHRLDLSAGCIWGKGEEGAIMTFGPCAVLLRDQFPLSADLGISPTLISREGFGNTDFGSLFQFTSHGGLYWDISDRWRLGYRFQHMSNAGLGDHNPGLNLHMFILSFRF